MRFLKPKPKAGATKRPMRKSTARRSTQKAKTAGKGKSAVIRRRTVRRTADAVRVSSRPKLRRRPPILLQPRNLVRLAAGLAVITLVGGTLWMWQSGWMARQTSKAVQAAYDLTAGTGWKVVDLQVAGRQRTPAPEILQALDIRRDMPILQIDPQEARQRLEALPWVRQAEVERHLPGVVFVRLHEREPLAVWQMEGNLHLIDNFGEVIPETKAQMFNHLPLVVGPGAQHQAADLIALLASEPELKDRVTGAVWVSERRWNLQMDGDIEVRLPEGDLSAAWRQLAQVEREHGVFARDVKIIDMRLPDRLVVRTSPDAKPLSHPSEDEEST